MAKSPYGGYDYDGEYPAIEAFFGAYLNPDWDADFASVVDVIKYYVNSHSKENVDVQRLLKLHSELLIILNKHPEEQLEILLQNNRGGGYEIREKNQAMLFFAAFLYFVEAEMRKRNLAINPS
jgi:hypothetical protein